MSTFAVRLLDDDPAARFVYYDHTEERAGDAERVITAEWSDHQLADLDRVMSMLATLGHHFEVRGLTLVAAPLIPTGYRWGINPKARNGHSPRSIAEASA